MERGHEYGSCLASRVGCQNIQLWMNILRFGVLNNRHNHAGIPRVTCYNKNCIQVFKCFIIYLPSQNIKELCISQKTTFYQHVWTSV